MAELQKKTLVRCPDSKLIDPAGYNAPGFEQGQNIFCAFNENRTLLGYGWIHPFRLLRQPDEVLILPMDLRVDPDYEQAESLRDRLLEAVFARARVLRARFTQPRAMLSATYFAGGRASIDYLLGKGFRHYTSDYTLRRDLRQPLPERKAPLGVELRTGRLQTLDEQQEYLQALAACEKEEWSLDGLQNFLNSNLWTDGAVIAAYARGQLAGSLLAYYEPDLACNPDQVGSTERVFVVPAFRGRGIARVLLLQGMQYLQQRGMSLAELTVSAENRSELQAYERSGYFVWQEGVSLGMEI